jgi:chromate transporter
VPEDQSQVAAEPGASGNSRPRSPADLFFAFNRLALQGFGGVLPVAQRELVEHQRWMSKAEFVALLSLGQVLPGPNIVNMALIFGDRHFGWRGALAALAGLMLAPLLIVLVLAVLVRQGGTSPVVNGALRGMGVVAAGLVLSTALKLSGALRGNPIGWVAAAVVVVVTTTLVAALRWPLAGVLAVVGPLAWAWAWWRLAR